MYQITDDSIEVIGVDRGYAGYATATLNIEPSF
jgi:hypothetical protein